MTATKSHIKKKLRLAGLLLALLLPAVFSVSPLMAQGDERFRVYTDGGETYMDGNLAEVFIFAQRPDKKDLRRGQRRLNKYTRLMWNIHRTYPYALKLSEILTQVEQDLEDIENPKIRKDYLQIKERELFSQYDKEIRNMTRSQGKVLVKLIYRQTGSSSFELIKASKSGTAAFFWQTLGLLFGINLKSEYDPEEERMIEDIVLPLDAGGYNIVYHQFDYQLP